VLAFFLGFYRIKFFKPASLFKLGACIVRLKFFLQQRRQLVDFQRFQLANILSSKDYVLDLSDQYKLHLIIVATSKDFDVLKKTFHLSMDSLSNFKNVSVELIIPPADIKLAQSLDILKDYNVKIVDENLVLNGKYFESLTRIFGTRNTWVYQQALKLNAIANSDSDFSMILDADTILLNKRAWVTENGVHLLTPSDEFNFDYYDFLNKLGVGGTAPMYTFVSHHMLYNPKLVRAMLSELNFSHRERQIQAMEAFARPNAFSPICIDYELYGQWMMSEREQHYYLAKWSNIGITKKNFEKTLGSKFRMAVLGRAYHSMSFHSWS
jgi:hypothetical protein